MNEEFSALCRGAQDSSATVLDNLAELGRTLGDVQSEVGKLPFFVRGFVSSEVTRGSGQDIPAWVETVNRLATTVRDAQAATVRCAQAGAASGDDRALFASAAGRIEAEQPRLQKLREFMQQAPSKVNAVPAGILPADRRGEFVQAVSRQVRAVGGALDAMPGLVQGLRALSA